MNDNKGNVVADKLSFINTFEVNLDVSYQCRGKMKFSHNYHQKSIQSTCLAENKWKEPSYWGKCVECKTIKITYCSKLQSEGY